jgi:shikimate dehydrogenase
MTVVLNLGLIGYPLGHSLSPKIHRAALDSCGLEGDYSLFPIHPEDQPGLKDLLARVRSSEITGLNVTIPHKQTVIPLLDRLTPAARAIGAVNTIFTQNGKLTGENTDAPGFLADLRRFLSPEILANIENSQKNSEVSVVSVVNKCALVLGAGGSARAVVYALTTDGWSVTIAARRPEQARELIAQLPTTNSRLSVIDYQITNLQSLIPDLSLIINTTPLGMHPGNQNSPWPEGLPFPPNAAVYDLVYNPRETKLVKDTRAAGLAATTGLGMLIEQAALSFELWTGHTPSRKLLFDTLVE